MLEAQNQPTSSRHVAVNHGKSRFGNDGSVLRVEPECRPLQGGGSFFHWTWGSALRASPQAVTLRAFSPKTRTSAHPFGSEPLNSHLLTMVGSGAEGSGRISVS
jgi:hypothetical protein